MMSLAMIAISLAGAISRTPHTGRYMIMGYAVLAIVLGGYSIYLLIKSLRERHR